jgi:hypothetical protein
MSANDNRLQIPPSCHTDTQAIYAYWLDKCGDRRMPARADIDPIDIPRLLPGICLVDVVPDERRYVYRLAGTSEVEVRGYDPTGKSVVECFFGFTVEDALSCYDRVVATKAPFLDCEPFTATNGRYVTEETVFLPLSDDGINVNKILVFSHCEHARPSAEHLELVRRRP